MAVHPSVGHPSVESSSAGGSSFMGVNEATSLAGARQHHHRAAAALSHLPLIPQVFLRRSGDDAIPLPSAVGAEGDVTRVSMTMQCVINLTVVYFFVYTCLAVCRTYTQLGGRWRSNSREDQISTPALRQRGRLPPTNKVQRIFEAAERTVVYAPMLCVLFLAARMRALQLTKGQGSPQAWVQAAMQVCTWAVLLQTTIVILLPLITGEVPMVDDDGNVLSSSPREADLGKSSFLHHLLTMVRLLLMTGLYGGFIAVCVGIATMLAPKELWPEGVPAVSPAVSATINLSVQYFAVYLAMAVSRAYNYLMGRETSKMERLLKLAAYTVNFAPMLCILFIGARMRALQIDPEHGNPQPWAQTCFYICCYSVFFQTILVLAVPLIAGVEAKAGGAEGDVEFEIQNYSLALTLTVIRYVVMLCLYGGFTAVIVSVIMIKNPDGPTPPISPTMQCVMNLTIQFFAVYLVLWICLTIRQFSGRRSSSPRSLEVILYTLENARGTVQYCPMLCVLFVGTRMRALQISGNTGAPQGWAQDAMFLCSYALLLQLAMCLILPCFTGEISDVDHDGNVTPPAKPRHVVCAWVVTIIRYTALIALYGGVVTVIVSLFVISPETANGRGAMIPASTYHPPHEHHRVGHDHEPHGSEEQKVSMHYSAPAYPIREGAIAAAPEFSR